MARVEQRRCSIKIESVQPLAARLNDLTGTVERNFGPEDMHAINAIAYIMNGILVLALVLYGAIIICAT
jgi:hypothetical protein